MEQFSFRSELIRSGNIQIQGRDYSPQEIILKLEPLLTKARVARIDQVIASRTWNLAAACEGLYDLGNISAVMRSAESFGFSPFHIIEKIDAKYKKSERISKGSEKWLHIQKHKSPSEFINSMKASGYQILATTLVGGRDIKHMNFSKPTAVVFGNEKDGVSEEILKQADDRFFVPMLGFTQSFNISVAAALSFYHIYQERMRIFDKSGDLSAPELAALKAQYYLRTIGNDETISTLLER